ncbi:MAG TPA: disulfide bond formation protein B [Alphaproteobacteria bacterium]|nr:disulfide bond formation protein B [Alphaproteobacteria bacterium]
MCALISAALLGGALLFEHVGGMAPCSLCIWQRWAHVAVIVCALGWLVISQPIGASLRAGLIITALAGITSVGVAGYHAGVEWQLWAGPAGCTASLSSGGSTADLVDSLLATPVVRCDDVPWSLFGLSMAGWNMLLSVDIVALAMMSFIFGDRNRTRTS